MEDLLKISHISDVLKPSKIFPLRVIMKVDNMKEENNLPQKAKDSYKTGLITEQLKVRLNCSGRPTARLVTERIKSED